jgi:tRNA threonylcarbamoyladenosine biosynthesis protein TsaB
MNILALDTSTRFLCCALKFNGRFVGYMSDFKRHSEILIPVLRKLLKKADKDLSEIDFFGVGIGPGSFTGLRIGIATIKGFCFALRKRTICIPSLDTIANNVSNTESLICPIVDAKRNLVYSSLYRKRKRLKRVSKYLLISIEELLERISEPVIFLGDGLSIYRDFLEKKLKREREFLPEEFWYPKPDSLISLAKERIEKKMFCEPDRILPLYLYPKECQIKK